MAFENLVLIFQLLGDLSGHLGIEVFLTRPYVSLHMILDFLEASPPCHYVNTGLWEIFWELINVLFIPFMLAHFS